MFCPECGTKARKSDKFCASCGTRLDRASAAIAAVQSDSDEGPAIVEIEPPSSRRATEDDDDEDPKPRKTARLAKGRKVGKVRTGRIVGRGTKRLGSAAKLKKPEPVKRKLSPEEEEARKKRQSMIWLVGNSGKPHDIRLKIVQTMALISPAEMRAICDFAEKNKASACEDEPILTEILATARECPVGDTETKYDPNRGYRDILIDCARSLEDGIEEKASLVSLKAQREIARLLTRGMVSASSAYDLFEDYHAEFWKNPARCISFSALGLCQGFAGVPRDELHLDQETVESVLQKLEEQRPYREADKVALKLLERQKSCVEQLRRRVLGLDSLDLGSAEEGLFERGGGTAVAAPPRTRPAAKPAAKPAARPAAKAPTLTPATVAKLANDPDKAVEIAAVIEKIPLEKFESDGFIVVFLKLAAADEGTVLRRKLARYAFEHAEADGESRKKARILAKNLLEVEVIEDDDDVEGAMRSELGEAILDTLDELFRKERGSLEERIEGAEAFLATLVDDAPSREAFLHGLAERLEESELCFRQPGIQTTMLRFKSVAGEGRELGARKADVDAVRSRLQAVVDKAMDGDIQFATDRAQEYFYECAETVLDVLEKLQAE